MQNSESLIDRSIIGSLALFGLGIALSKSADTIVIGIIYLSAVILLVKDAAFRKTIQRIALQPLVLPLALYLGVAVLGLFFTPSFHDGMGIIGKTLGLIMVYVMISVLLDFLPASSRQHHAEQLLLIFLVGIFILDLIAGLTYLGVVGNRKHFLPLTALNVHHIWFSNLNAIGIYAAAAIFFYSPQRTDPRMRAFIFTLVPVALICILLSLSRTAWLGLLVTVVALAFVYIKKKKILYIVLLALLGSLIILYRFNPIVHSRIDLVLSEIHFFEQGEGLTTNVGSRFVMWKAAIKMFLTNPLIGVGTGGYVATMNRYIASGEIPEYFLQFNQPHNMYMFALATNGLLGLGTLLFIFYTSLRFAAPLLKSTGGRQIFAFLAIAATVHFMIAGLTDSFFNIQMLRYAFAFMIGICVRNSLRPDVNTEG